jgi:predicted Rossmann-fold nucleotide-binding protein
MTKYADLIFINDKGGLGTVEEILYVLDLIEREPEFEGESGLLNMLKSAGYEEGKLFHVIEDIEELIPIMKEALEKKYERQREQEKIRKK